MSRINITPRDHPQGSRPDLPDVGEAWLPFTPRTQGTRRWASRGRRAGRRDPEPRNGRGAGAAAPVRAPGVGELRTECVWSPGRRAGARAVAHALRPAARAAAPVGQAVPRRLGQAPAPGQEEGRRGAGEGPQARPGSRWAGGETRGPAHRPDSVPVTGCLPILKAPPSL